MLDSTTLEIAEMCCPTEERLIQSKLETIPGVKEFEFNLMRRTLTFKHEPKSLTLVIEALKSIGFKAKTLRAQSEVGQKAHSINSKKREWILLGVAIILALLAELTHWIEGPKCFEIVLSLLAVLGGGLKTYKKGFIALKNGDLNINALMSAAVTGGLIIGVWPEAAMVMVLFALAELIEGLSLDRARNAIKKLMHFAPEKGLVLQTDGSWKEMPAKFIELASIVRVRPGERIVLDGTITRGNPAINQSPVTGESIPVEKEVGEIVYAGSINESGEFEFKVTALAAESTLARIIHAVEAAQGSRAPTHRFVDSFAKIYTPSVFILSLLVMLIPPLMSSAAWYEWIYRALVLLVIACPCALVISTPVTIVSGLAAAARRGILIKGGVYLEQGRKLRVLAFDKTGTLTHGKAVLTDWISIVSNRADNPRRFGELLALRSDHPVSRAIAASAKTVDDSEAEIVSHFRAIPGRGVTGQIHGKVFSLGNRRFVNELGAETDELKQQLQKLEGSGKSVAVLTENGHALGIFAVSDTLRDTSRDALSELNKLGVETVMLTGDNQDTAETIAKDLDLGEFRAELLPEDKLAVIEDLIKKHSIVGMVGDGINDAPALAKATIGFAMGAAASDAALETADVALMDDDLRKIPTFIHLSRKTTNVLTQNIGLALGIKALFLSLTILGHVNMWMAVFADMGGSLLVVMNGLRLLNEASSRGTKLEKV